jgi:hypothetical protein
MNVLLELGVSAMPIHSIELSLSDSVQFGVLSNKGNKWMISGHNVNYFALLDNSNKGFRKTYHKDEV